MKSDLAQSRWLYPDVLRGVAIIAMLIAHAMRLLPLVLPWAEPVFGRINAVASPLFATVMGMSAAIMFLTTERRGSVVWHNTVRGLALIAIALVVAEWNSWIAIVLGQLGLVLWLGTPLLLFRTRVVAAIAIVVTVVSSPLNKWVLENTDYQQYGVEGPGFFGQLVLWFFTNPNYRFTNLLPYFLFGAVLVSIGFARRPDVVRSSVLFGIGLVTHALATLWYSSMTIQPISGSYSDNFYDLSLVLLALGFFGLLATLNNEIVDRTLDPIRVVGTVALSVYVLQIALVGWMNTSWGLVYGQNYWGAWLLLVVGVVFVGWLWGRFLGRGPIEWIIGLLSGRYLPRRSSHRKN